ncbi:transposase [Streptomyces peucetius]|uniref:Transposase n=1 Tax=Streptomyces peucetius TaxID=1950 RepID=A0ABY6I6K8_STRPE|nr:transposase [Streptomyces peucetius]UYQ62630.1 transposase [Streptomyces peucetius]
MATQHTTQAWASVSAFTEVLFGRLPRADQRRWADAYMRGLLTTPGKKTVRRLAATVSDSSTAPQALHQFVNASPWEWEPVRAELARWVGRRTRPRALVIGPVVLPKRGDRSCGVHRRFVPQAGRTVNCQVGIGAFLSTDSEVVPVDWRLLLPEEWSQDPQQRRRARIPDTVRPGRADSAAAQALDMAEESGRRRDLAGLPVVVDLTGYADADEVVRGLMSTGRNFVVAVPDSFPLVPAAPDRQLPGGTDGAVAAQRFLALHCSRRPRKEEVGTHGVARTPAGEEGAGVPGGIRGAGARQVTVLTGLVRLPGTRPLLRVFAEWDPAACRTGQVWLADLAHRPVADLLGLAGLHAATTDTLERLESDFGLRAFEGRSYPGWHRHMTLVSAAFAYSSLSRDPCPVPAASPRPTPRPAPRRTPTRTACN